MSRLVGAHIENNIVKLLKKNKFNILGQNFTTKFGELDIIAFERTTKTLVFVEVKYRRSDCYGRAEEMLSYAKQKKLYKTAQIYFKLHPKYIVFPYRFDFIAQTGESVNWIKNVINAY